METNNINHEDKIEAMPHSGEAGHLVLREAIDNDRKEVFILEYHEKNGFPKNKQELNHILETSYASFSMRFTGLRDAADDPSPIYNDVEFMEKTTLALYRTFYTKEPLLSVFPDEITKERYFSLLGKYIYANDFDAVLVEAAKSYPRKNQFLTTSEIDALLSDYIMSEEEQRRLGILPKEDK